MNKQEAIAFLEEHIPLCQEEIDYAIDRVRLTKKIQAWLVFLNAGLWWLWCIIDIVKCKWWVTIVDAIVGMVMVVCVWFSFRGTIRVWRETKRNWARLRDLFKKELEEIQNDF